MGQLLASARRSVWLAWFIDNPLLVREIRRRMRGRLFSWSLIGYLVALGGVSCVLMFTTYPFSRELDTRQMIQDVGRIGATLFKGMCFVEGIIALFLAPMLTAGLATAEKEKDTFDFLRVTTLNSRTFVSGCLLTTACFLLLVFTCTLPILGLTFIFGGVSMQEIMSFNLTLFLLALAVSAWGIFNSTSYKRSRSVQGSIFVLFLLGLFFGSRFLALGGFGWASPFGGGLVSFLLTVILPLALITVFFSIAAARRLYEPNNRMFNYKQYTVFLFGVLGAIAGFMAYHMYANPGVTMDPDEIRGGLAAMYFVGWVFIGVGIILLSSGRVEMGDELWKIRLRFPIFRRIDERVFVYGFYILGWLGLTYVLGAAWDGSGEHLAHWLLSMPIVLLSFLAIFSIVACISIFTESRNRATIMSILTLVFLWGVVPAVGLFLTALTPGSNPNQTLFDEAGNLLIDTSPITALAGIWGDEPSAAPMIAAAALAAISVLFLLPFLSKGLRGRFTVSYDWTSPRRDEAEAEAVSAG